MNVLKRLFGSKGQKIAANTIQGQFGITAQLAGSSGKSINFSGYVFDGESKESLEGRIDILQEIIDRQRIRSEIPELEAKREQLIKGLQQAREVLADFKDRQPNLSSQERLNMRNLATNIVKMTEEIDKGEAAIKEAKLRAGVG